MKTAVSTGSLQYVLNTCFILSMQRAILSIVWFLRSTTLFCCGK